jgi:hypothetical protein
MLRESKEKRVEGENLIKVDGVCRTNILTCVPSLGWKFSALIWFKQNGHRDKSLSRT